MADSQQQLAVQQGLKHHSIVACRVQPTQRQRLPMDEDTYISSCFGTVMVLGTVGSHVGRRRERRDDRERWISESSLPL